jgi:hypothetical protein
MIIYINIKKRKLSKFLFNYVFQEKPSIYIDLTKMMIHLKFINPNLLNFKYIISIFINIFGNIYIQIIHY